MIGVNIPELLQYSKIDWDNVSKFSLEKLLGLQVLSEKIVYWQLDCTPKQIKWYKLSLIVKLKILVVDL